MADRGEYRAIRRVLLDGPDFQRQSRDARWVFVALKLNFGPAGIEVWYPAELTARLSAQTGVSVAGIQEALITLERDGWIEREANVVWIVEQLRHDPHITPANPKHRTMVESHVSGLPNLAIVRRFVRDYADWFRSNGKPDGEPLPRLRNALDTVSDRVCDTVSKPTRSTENKTENKTEDKSLVPSDDGTGEPPRDSSYPPTFESVWGIYPRRFGGNSKKEAYQAWRARLRSGVPAEVLHAGVLRYAAFCEADRKVGTKFVMMASSFFGTGDHYLEPWEIEAPDVLPIQNRARVLTATEMLIV